MSIKDRLAKAEGGFVDTLLWCEAEKLAVELDQRPEVLYQEARDLIDRYWYLARRLPRGKVDFKPVLRAIAKDEALDYEELLDHMKHLVRGQTKGKRLRS